MKNVYPFKKKNLGRLQIPEVKHRVRQDESQPAFSVFSAFTSRAGVSVCVQRWSQNLQSSHCLPLNPSAQLQMKDSPALTHVPPFWQDTLRQSCSDSETGNSCCQSLGGSKGLMFQPMQEQNLEKLQCG